MTKENLKQKMIKYIAEFKEIEVEYNEPNTMIDSGNWYYISSRLAALVIKQDTCIDILVNLLGPEYLVTNNKKIRINIMSELKEEHYRIILLLENGADILCRGTAKLLREIQCIQPKFIKICKARGKYSIKENLPYFGAISTKAGLFVAKNELRSIAITFHNSIE